MTVEAELRRHAESVLGDNQSPGGPGWCRPSMARWTVELLSPEQLVNVFASPEEARQWLNSEIEMDRQDELHRDWHRLLVEDIREEVVLLIREGKAYIWDGWHRAAAAIATGRSLPAIVGRPVDLLSS